MTRLPQELIPVFRRLRSILAKHSRRLVVVEDTAAHYYLDTAYVQPNGRPLFFGAARIGKRYVSFHLMPLYCFPDLIKRAPARIKSKMQGKSCFHFTKIDSAQLEDLSALANAGIERLQLEGRL